jgi:hypothetical protein
MRRLVPLPPETVGSLKVEKETGPGYQVVAVELKDGRHFDQVIASEGCIIAVRGHLEVPFQFDEVAAVSVNHRRWNFRTLSDKSKLKSRAASA